MRISVPALVPGPANIVTRSVGIVARGLRRYAHSLDQQLLLFAPRLLATQPARLDFAGDFQCCAVVRDSIGALWRRRQHHLLAGSVVDIRIAIIKLSVATNTLEDIRRADAGGDQ